MDRNSDKKRDRERDEFERHRERNEERDRERETDRDRDRDAMSRRVTRAESQTRPRRVGGSKRTLHDGTFSGTPPKRQQLETVSSHIYTATGARPKEPVARYRGTEPSITERGGQASTTQYQTSDRVHITHERRRLFDNDGIESDAFTDMFMGAAEKTQPAEMNATMDKLIATMDKQQLTSSLQQMVQKWKELQGNAAAGAQPCRPSASNSQLLRPAIGTHTGSMTSPPKKARRRLPELPRESLPLRGDRSTPEPKGEIPTPTPAHQTKTPDNKAEAPTGHDDKQRKPAAKLESYAGQGASVESFLAKFESHAKYFKWSEQDRVFQLKNSLTGTAAQALWTGGENATSAELIQLLHSRHGGKLQFERFWSELRTRRRRKDEPLQDVSYI